jgi:hypothetical protein
MGWNTRELRVIKSPTASGSAEQWVREKFPDELSVYRQRRQRAASALISMIDADTKSVQDRINEFEDACNSMQIAFRSADEAVAFAVPKRNIETWIHFLGGDAVNEEIIYPKLNRERRCKPAVDHLVELCRKTGLTAAAPHSLALACDEYASRIMPMK